MTPELQAVVTTLREEWNAPVRHVRLRECSTKNKPWIETFEGIRGKLGTGITVALAGQRGCGKTQLGVELMRVATGHLRRTHYILAMEFFMAIKETYKPSISDTEVTVCAKYRRPSLLVIDEVGKRADTEWEDRLFFYLLDQRYRDMKDTILISNDSLVDFETGVGASIASRMNEGGGIIDCSKWPSFR